VIKMKKLRELITKPSKFFKKKLSLKESLLWFSIGSAFFSIMVVLVNGYAKSAGFFKSFITVYALVWVSYIIVSGITSLSAISLHAKSLKKIFMVFAYSMIPFMLFGWIPYVSILVLVWSLSTTFIGISEVERMSYEKSSLAVAVGIFISTLVFISMLVY